MEKEHKYELLTSEMMEELDNQIKCVGREELLKRLAHNRTELIIQEEQNRPDAFKEAFMNGCHYKWQYEAKRRIMTPMMATDIFQEMLDYVEFGKDRKCKFKKLLNNLI